MSSGQILFIAMGLIVGGLFAAVGVHGLVTNLRLLRSGVRTKAIVAGYETSESWDHDTRRTTTYFHPIVEFTDQHGRKQRVVLQTGSSSKEHAESYPVPVRYAPEDPSSACIDTFMDMWFMVVMPLGIGLIGITAAVLVWVFDKPVRMN